MQPQHIYRIRIAGWLGFTLRSQLLVRAEGMHP